MASNTVDHAVLTTLHVTLYDRRMAISTNTKYGWQPAREVIHGERLTFREVASKTGVSYTHLMNALYGAVAPSAELKIKLPQVLGVPLEMLFTDAAISGSIPVRVKSITLSCGCVICPDHEVR